MIVILCPSFWHAKDAFEIFVNFLSREEPGTIMSISESALYVNTDSDLTYVFVDRRYEEIFENFDPPVDFVDSFEFFYDLYNYHDYIYTSEDFVSCL